MLSTRFSYLIASYKVEMKKKKKISTLIIYAEYIEIQCIWACMEENEAFNTQSLHGNYSNELNTCQQQLNDASAVKEEAYMHAIYAQ